MPAASKDDEGSDHLDMRFTHCTLLPDIIVENNPGKKETVVVVVGKYNYNIIIIRWADFFFTLKTLHYLYACSLIITNYDFIRLLIQSTLDQKQAGDYYSCKALYRKDQKQLQKR